MSNFQYFTGHTIISVALLSVLYMAMRAKDRT